MLKEKGVALGRGNLLEMADAGKKAEEKPAEGAPKQADASLEDLLEDDEFEEFETEGAVCRNSRVQRRSA